MQRQQEREPDTRQKSPRARRSVGELLAAWLLVLWGAGCIYLIGPMFLEIIRKGMSEFRRDTDITIFLFVFQAILCLMAGLTALFRRRTLAKWTLFVTGLCWIGVVCNYFMIDPTKQPDYPWSLFWPSIFLLAALLLFFLGWWLGRLEDS